MVTRRRDWEGGLTHVRRAAQPLAPWRDFFWARACFPHAPRAGGVARDASPPRASRRPHLGSIAVHLPTVAKFTAVARSVRLEQTAVALALGRDIVPFVDQPVRADKATEPLDAAGFETAGEGAAVGPHKAPLALLLVVCPFAIVMVAAGPAEAAPPVTRVRLPCTSVDRSVGPGVDLGWRSRGVRDGRGRRTLGFAGGVDGRASCGEGGWVRG